MFWGRVRRFGEREAVGLCGEIFREVRADILGRRKGRIFLLLGI